MALKLFLGFLAFSLASVPVAVFVGHFMAFGLGNEREYFPPFFRKVFASDFFWLWLATTLALASSLAILKF